MNSSNKINLNGKEFSTDWILDNYQELPAEDFSENEIKTLTFCGQWLSGQRQFFVHTSGSTGDPQLIELTRQQMVASARITAKALHLDRGDHALACLSTAHIAGLMMLVRGFELGLKLTIVEPASDPFKSFDFEKVRCFDFAAFVPLQLQSILKSGGRNFALLNEMKAILVGGAPVSPSLSAKIELIKAPVYQTFGMTETASHIALRRLNGSKVTEIYEALPGVEIRSDKRGCLALKSAVTGYKWLATNDLVELTGKNRFVWLGRIDNVINTGGVKVPAEKVERALAEVMNENDRAFFICGLPDSELGEAVTAVVEGEELSTNRQSEIREMLFQKLNKYELPKKFEFLDSLTRTPNGKIDRMANLKRIIDESL